MFLEPVRITAEWLAHETFGIAAMLAALPKDLDVTLPDAVDIRDSTRDPQAALEQVPDDLTGPGILVSPANIAPVRNPGLRPMPTDQMIEVLIRIAIDKQHTANALNDSSLLLRAIMRSLSQIMVTPQGEAARSRNEVLVYGMPEVQPQAVFTVVKDIDVTAGLLVTYQCRDLFASS